ncbi:hypothetical protein, partial [Halolactibacillus halophilus]|uniref:hypothetical protein n=1 Tax=Halolactibacillus halophilus TaxID=306540 RepID=UPI001F1C1213
AIAQPTFISPLPLGYALHTLEEGDFFRKYVKIILDEEFSDVRLGNPITTQMTLLVIAMF